MGLRSSPGVDLALEKGCASLTPCKAQAALPNQPSLAWFGWLLAIKKRGLVGWISPCLEKSRTYLAETGWTSPLPGGGLVEALPLPQTKQSRWHNSTRGLAKQPRRRSRLGRPEKLLHFLNSLQGCLAKSGLCLPSWTSPCLEKPRTYLAETGGWTSPLPGGGLVEALPLPQTKQSRWHNSTRACEAAQASISPWTSRKRLHFLNPLQGCLAKSGLCLPGWTSPCLEKSRTYLAETGVAGPPRCLGAALWRHCPSHKRSKVDGTILNPLPGKISYLPG